MKNFLFWLILGWIIVFWYFFIKENPENEYIIKTKTRINNMFNKTATVGIANPASTYCIENNWTLEIKDEVEGQIGICTFTDGSTCEERAFFRGECSPGKQIEIQTGSQPTEIGTPIEEPTACTMEYAPVCAKVAIQCIKAPCDPIEQTFWNRCSMNANKLATFLHEWECEADKKECPQYMPPSPDFCTQWIIEDWWMDQNGCQLPPKCVTKE